MSPPPSRPANIAEQAFYGWTNLTGVTIPITSIGGWCVRTFLTDQRDHPRQRHQYWFVCVCGIFYLAGASGVTATLPVASFAGNYENLVMNKKRFPNELMRTVAPALSAGCIWALVAGCAGGRSDFSPPSYQVQSAAQRATDYNLHQAAEQTPIVQSTPPNVVARTAGAQLSPSQSAPQTVNPTGTVQSGPAAALPSAEAQPGAGASPGTQAQAAPVAQQEIIPSSPGPEYIWMPGYWTIGVGGGWVWIGGHYVIRRSVSEEQLRAARGMLEQARISLTGKALNKTDKAIDQINEALHDYRTND